MPTVPLSGRQLHPTVLVGLLLMLGIGGCGLSSTFYPIYTPYPTYTLTPSQAGLVWPSTFGYQVVSWQDAARYYGQSVTVEGIVVRTYNSGNAVFLNFDQNYRNTFKIVIFPEDWGKFPASPEILFRGKLVRVTGEVREYEGAPEIIVKEPAQIRIAFEGPCPQCPPCPTGALPSPLAVTSPTGVALSPPEALVTPFALEVTPIPMEKGISGPVISWQDAAQHYGQRATVEGNVVKGYKSEKAIFLNFHEDYRRHFKAVIFADDWGKFPTSPDELYLSKKVRVSGLIEEYQGAPEIIVEEPSQIEIVRSGE